MPLFLVGDFNTKIDVDFISSIKTIDDGLQYIFDKQEAYFTENRIQKRNRDGQVGLSVVRRTVDAIFYKGAVL